LHQTSAGEWRLTTTERRAILLNNIYGVDLDPQAVEVTKLSLLLKVLEGESEEAINAQLKMFHERALPDLADNIKCGNSLIEGSFYDGKEMALFPEEKQVRINAFDWSSEFKGISGFDAVIGNPPYIRIQEMQKRNPEEVEYFKEQYQTGSMGSYDIYVLFVEKALDLLHEKGRMGFILPNKFFTAKYGRALRGMITQGRHLFELVDFTDQQVFKDATTYTTLLFMSKNRNTKFYHTEVKELHTWRLEPGAGRKQFPANTLSSDLWVVVHDDKERALYERLKGLRGTKPLSSIIQNIGQGIRTSRNQVYVLHDVTEHPTEATVEGHSVELDKRVTVNLPLAKRFLDGKAAKAYSLSAPGQAVIVPYTVAQGKAYIIEEATMRKIYKKTFDYLTKCKEPLEDRERGRLRGKPNWYGYIYPKNLEVMTSPKLVVPDTANSAAVAIDDQGQYVLTSGWGITLKETTKVSLWYVMALLNSPILDFFWRKVSTRFQGGYYRYFHENLNPIPIYCVNFRDTGEKAIHDAIVADAKALVEAYETSKTATTGQIRTNAQRAITRLTQKINKKVADLYGLTIEERTLLGI
jgi:hypothetical protein|tara:strand:+ start:1788 stop:3530 length:1743 start_codon:yes stop_codon:yes gene_type:complete